MNENELYLVKEYNFDNPTYSEVDFILDSCFKDCHNNYFHKFKYECIYDIKFKNIANNKIVNFTLSGKNMDLYDLNNKLKVTRQNGFIFIHINKLTIKFYSHQRYINIKYYLKHRMSMGHRLFFKIISQNKEYVKNFYNDLDNPFHFALWKWINQLNKT